MIQSEWKIWDRNPSEPVFQDYTYIRHNSWSADQTIELIVLDIPRQYVYQLLESKFSSDSVPYNIAKAVENLDVQWIDLQSRITNRVDRATKRIRSSMRKKFFKDMDLKGE